LYLLCLKNFFTKQKILVKKVFLQLNFRVLGWFNLLAALGITEWVATWVRQLYQGNCLQGKNPRQSPTLDL